MHSSDQRKTERSIVLLPICLILVVIAVLNLFGGDKAYSETEKRPLAARPKIEVSALRDGRFFADADAWYADQFLGRDFWIRLHDTGNRLFGLRESSDVLAGKNGRLFGKPEAHKGRRMGVVLCYGEVGDDVNALRDKAKRLAATVLGTDPYMKK